jgi:hypothetical protein
MNMRARVTVIFSMLFTAVAAGGAVHAQPAGGLLGQPLAAARSSDLFTFFNLAQTARQPCGDGQAVGFRPTGEQFHLLAAVDVMTDARGDVAAMTLTLDRAFINDPTNGVFARDIAKSFLRDVSGPRAGAGVTGLAEEIESGVSSIRTLIYRSDVAPAKPNGPPSTGYRVFLGDQPSYTLSADGEALTLANEPQSGKAVLRLSFSRGGAVPACAMGKVPD